MKEPIYIAGPYTSHATGLATRYAEQCQRAAVLTRYAADVMHLMRVAVFSPVTHGHALWLASGCQLGRDAAAWAPVNDPIMALCQSIHVVRIKGWERSTGVRREIEHFEARGIVPIYVDLPVHFYKHRRELYHCHPEAA